MDDTKTVLITKDNVRGKIEIFGPVYECPECKNTNIIFTFKYCPYCGTKLKWDFEKEN